MKARWVRIYKRIINIINIIDKYNVFKTNTVWRRVGILLVLIQVYCSSESYFLEYYCSFLYISPTEFAHLFGKYFWCCSMIYLAITHNSAFLRCLIFFYFVIDFYTYLNEMTYFYQTLDPSLCVEFRIFDSFTISIETRKLLSIDSWIFFFWFVIRARKCNKWTGFFFCLYFWWFAVIGLDHYMLKSFIR